jgi:DNA-binding HxlR family transcriptional regulator
MRRKSFEEMNCSVAQTLEVVGEWWSMLIIRDCFLGITRFDDFQERLGISRNILTDRLEHLVKRDVLVRVPYQDHPVRYDYRLTDKGRDLWLVLSAMRQWGDRWEAPDGAPVVVDHRACGHEATVVATCSACGEAIGARDVVARPGPGAAARPADSLLPPARSS